MPNATASYVIMIKRGRSPQTEIIECFLEDLGQVSSSRDSETIGYTISSKKLQKDLERKGKSASQIVIGRTIKAFLDYSNLKEGRDYTLGGCPRKYHFEKFNKDKIREMNKFREA